jgi:hypothetical protein
MDRLKPSNNASRRFSRFAVADWSGAKGDRHAGIALAVCGVGTGAPELVAPPTRFWSRQAMCDWVRDQNDDILIGFDFSFAPPALTRGCYFPGDDTPAEAKPFWAYIENLCDDVDLGAASLLERHLRHHFYFGIADGRKADFMHHRICEQIYNAAGGGKPSTVYDVIGAAQVAKASFAGMRMLHHLCSTHPIWPFDALTPAGPLVIEIYTSIAARAAGLRKGRSKLRDGTALDVALTELGSEPHMPLLHYNDHATDAILTTAWLRANATRDALWNPQGLRPEIALREGWTFGVV